MSAQKRAKRGGKVHWAILLLIFLAVLALVGPWLAPYDPRALFAPMRAPSRAHPLGTNDIGNDILSEVLVGARFSLLIALLSSLGSTVLGTLVGLVAGYYRRLGFLLMRLVDILLAVPRFPLIILMAAFLKPGMMTLVAFFVLFGWPRMARLVRSQIISERHKGYVDAAVLLGARDRRVLFRHLAPSVLPILGVRFVLSFQHIMLAESGLSFLGLGDPSLRSWGNILHYAFECPIIFISDAWVRWLLPPGLCITLTVMALTFVGYGLEQQLDPRLSRR